ncbi:MAG: excisionase family DNA-binding protein [Oscillochloridaceae bacterium umkhey_bin13]
MEKPLFLTPEEASWVLQATPQTIRAWIREGTLKIVPRLGRQYRIYFDSVLECFGLELEQVLSVIQRGRAEKQAKPRVEGTDQTNKPQALIGAGA